MRAKGTPGRRRARTGWTTMTTKRMITIAAVTMLAAVTLAQAQYYDPPSTPKSAKVLKFNTMVGVSGSFLNPNDVRGVQGDTFPWIVRSVKGTLQADGHLIIKVRGLVYPVDQSVPPPLQGINDEAQFQAVVSCLTDDGQGGLVTVNTTTAPFAATPSGNANITARVTLPAPCAAPIVFIVGASDGQWFAMSGVRVIGP